MHLYWSSWADAQLDSKTGKVWPGMAGTGRQRVGFSTMLVASIDTDRPLEAAPASTQPPVKSNRQHSHSPAAQQQYGHSSNSSVAPSISSPIEHNDRLQDPSVPSVGTASPRPAPGLEHRGGPPNSPPTRFSASAADPTPPFQRRGRGPDSRSAARSRCVLSHDVRCFR